MSTGLRALMAAAEEKGDAISFPVTLTTGAVTVTGRVAPSAWWYQAAERDLESQGERVIQRAPKRSREEVAAQVASSLEQLLGDVKRSSLVEHQPAEDEVTLYQASVFPTISTGGTQSGGMSMSILRVPLSAVDNWWIVEPTEIKGSGSINWGVGFAF